MLDNWYVECDIFVLIFRYLDKEIFVNVLEQRRMNSYLSNKPNVVVMKLNSLLDRISLMSLLLLKIIQSFLVCRRARVFSSSVFPSNIFDNKIEIRVRRILFSQASIDESSNTHVLLFVWFICKRNLSIEQISTIVAHRIFIFKLNDIIQWFCLCSRRRNLFICIRRLTTPFFPFEWWWRRILQKYISSKKNSKAQERSCCCCFFPV